MNKAIDGDFVAVDGSLEAAGAMVWWELSGPVLLEDMKEALEAEGWDETATPEPASLALALGRAAGAALASKRQLLRPLSKRGSWEIVQESVVSEDDDYVGDVVEGCQYKSVLKGWVEDGAIVLRGDPEMAAKVRALVPNYQATIEVTDFSSWLLDQAAACHAVALRSRGGFYFIPKERLDRWQAVKRVTRACSGHSLREISAMRTEEAVEAIMSAVTREVVASFSEMEEWMKKDNFSNRGANVVEANLEKAREKVELYSKLLGAGMESVMARHHQVVGALTAVRLALKEEKP